MGASFTRRRMEAYGAPVKKLSNKLKEQLIIFYPFATQYFLDAV